MRCPFRPRLPGLLTAHWQNPALFSWPIADGALEPFVPAGVAIDRWNGSAYLSLVALWFADVRVLGIPAPLRRYEEVNLRFYVCRRGAGGDACKGVVFIRQMVPHRATAYLARRVYGEPFVATKMRHQFSEPDAGGPESNRRIAYDWEYAGRRYECWVETGGEGRYAEPGSLDEFLTARYWGYNGNPNRRTRAYRLSRPAWTLAPATDWGLGGDPAAWCGPPFADAMSDRPASVLVASDSWAQVHLPRRLVE